MKREGSSITNSASVIRLSPERTQREELLEAILHLSFHAFEQMVMELLVAMGYSSVEILGRTKRRQRTAHGGKDLQAVTETGVTTSRLLLQLKQYRQPVQRRFVDELRGVMDRCGAQHGLIITTSRFSKAAVRAAREGQASGQSVELLDGERLTDLLITHSIGVWPDLAQDGEDGPTWAIDIGYFEDLHRRFPVPPVKAAKRKPKRPRSVRVRVVVFDMCNETGGGMTWRTHLVGGIAALWLLPHLAGPVSASDMGPLATLAALGALLPDLDAARSKLSSLTVAGLRPVQPISLALSREFGHRGIMHSVLGLIGAGVILGFVSRWTGGLPALALWLGIASHLLLDSATVSGIPFGLGRKRLHLLPRPLRVVTGSLAEELVFALLAAAAVALLVQTLSVLNPI